MHHAARRPSQSDQASQQRRLARTVTAATAVTALWDGQGELMQDRLLVDLDRELLDAELHHVAGAGEGAGFARPAFARQVAAEPQHRGAEHEHGHPGEHRDAGHSEANGSARSITLARFR